VSYYPFTFRDADHVIKYGKSPVFKELARATRRPRATQITALTYYGARHATSATSHSRTATA
jgi:TRAP-type C4-dicarboxylate transport system substrate-binding protein